MEVLQSQQQHATRRIAILELEDEEAYGRCSIEQDVIRWFSRIVVEERLLHGQDAFPPISVERSSMTVPTRTEGVEHVPHPLTVVRTPSPRLHVVAHRATGSPSHVGAAAWNGASIASSCLSPGQEPAWPHGHVTSRLGVSPCDSDELSPRSPLRGAISPTAMEVEVSDTWISPPGPTQPHSTTFRTNMYSWPAESRQVRMTVEAVYRHLDSVVTDEAFSRTLIESDHRWYQRQMYIEMTQGLQRQYSWSLGGAHMAVRPFVTMQQAWRKLDTDLHLRHLPPKMRCSTATSISPLVGRRAFLEGPPISDLDAALDTIALLEGDSGAVVVSSSLGRAGASPLASLGYSTPQRPPTGGAADTSYHGIVSSCSCSPRPLSGASGCSTSGLASIVKDMVAKPPRIPSAASQRSSRTPVRKLVS
mmetsp:Transcript_60831/g.70614  ORF Transcript_60831/g.70614 Transcript_60831/m.70614 type:complete len:419 (-) Transcript_60831:663-1919(-)|eukprot:CAMPEP_0176411388 /NCGR_PEP_ID=MMETSP0127-20121128/3580_1 /TAXON_ID=938130 /ORGANISM="Platyophrya macrostoma, Strain WH" /LENGTH=418 /DNA_ID=CAMNT_0017790981 /DNA_START=77 /DNA_END=1333 /DNA_ORIENTATION=+